MKFLIVHDRVEVAHQIKDLLQEFLSAGDQVDFAEDQHDAREHLSRTIYDFLLVDLTIPHFKSNQPSPPGFAAIEQLLNELFSYDTLNVPGDVIGLTRDTIALDLVQNKLGPHMMVAIKEDDDGKWKEYLRDKIRYACRAARTRSFLINQHYDFDALILTAVDEESSPYRQIFQLTDYDLFPGAKQFSFLDKDRKSRRGISFSIGRSGQPSAASIAQALITFFRPRLALMSGFCGGVKNKGSSGNRVGDFGGS